MCDEKEKRLLDEIRAISDLVAANCATPASSEIQFRLGKVAGEVEMLVQTYDPLSLKWTPWMDDQAQSFGQDASGTWSE